MRGLAVCLEEVGGQHRRDHSGDGKRHQHRDHDGEAEVLEELSRDPGHGPHGEEHGDDTETGGDHWQADLVSRVDRGLVGSLAHPHVSDDVLDLDDRIVDQHACDQRQRQQGQLVEVEAEQIHEPEGRDRGQRDRDSRYRSRAPVAQEEEHDHDGKDGALDHCRHRAFVLVLGVFDRVEQRDELDARILRFDLRDLLERFFIDSDVRCALGAAHREIDDFLVADLADRCAFRIAIAHRGDIGQLDRTATAQLDLPLAERVGILAVAQHPHRLARAADFGHTARGIDIALAQHAVDLAGCHSQRLHPRQVEDNFDLAVDPAEAIDLGHAFDAEQLLGDRIVDEPAKPFDRHVVGFDRIDREEAAGDFLLGDARFENSVGQGSTHRVDRILHFGDRIVGIGADLDLDKGVRIALARGRIERIHAVDRAHGGFDALGDLVLDFGRRGAGLRNRDVDGGKLDVRIVDNIHPGEADQARQQQRRERHQRNDRVANRPGRDVAEIHRVTPA